MPISHIHYPPTLTLILTLILLTLLITPILTIQPRTVHKLTLTQTQTNQYSLDTEIGNARLSILAHLSDELDWVKADDCVLCQVKEGKAGEVCKRSCFSGEEGDGKGKGVKCGKGYCKKMKEGAGGFPYYINDGERVELKIKQHFTGTKLKYPTILTTKMSEQLPQLGRLNLLNGKHGLFGSNLVLVKDHAKDITVYYYGQQEQEQEQESSMVGSLIPLLQDVDIIEKDAALAKDIKDGKGYITGLVLAGAKGEGKGEGKDESEGEKDEGEENEEEQEVNVFDISEIKLKQLFKTQPKNIQSQQSSPTADPSTSIIPLQKSTAQLSIKTNRLLLPAPAYKKLTSELITRFFPPSASQSCQFKQNLLQCTNREILSLRKLDNVTVGIVLNGVEVEFPVRALVQSCGEKSCAFSMSVSKNKKSVIIGDFILNIFALQYNKPLNHFILYRLNNQWSQNFLKDRPFSSHEVNFMWMFIVFIFKAIMWALKAIALVSLLVLIVNCVVHWREVLDWVLDLLAKLGSKKLRGELKEEQMRVLGEKINKMSIRIKDRLGRKFRKSGKFSLVPNNSDVNLNQELSQQVEKKEERSKLMSLDELSDPESSVDEEKDYHGAKVDGSGKGCMREEAEKEILKEKQELEKKMATKGELPSILKSPPKQATQPLPKSRPQPQKQQYKQKELPAIRIQNEQQFYQFQTHDNQLQFQDF